MHYVVKSVKGNEVLDYRIYGNDADVDFAIADLEDNGETVITTFAEEEEVPVPVQKPTLRGLLVRTFGSHLR